MLRKITCDLCESGLFQVDKPQPLLYYRLNYQWPFDANVQNTVKDVVHDDKFQAAFDKVNRQTFGLKFGYKFDDIYVSFWYQPTEDHPNKEYLSVCYIFDHLKFINHSLGFENLRPRVTISINGRLYNRPDREYYVVFETSERYVVHVYQLGADMKRKHMLFAVGFDMKERTVSEPQIFYSTSMS